MSNKNESVLEKNQMSPQERAEIQQLYDAYMEALKPLETGNASASYIAFHELPVPKTEVANAFYSDMKLIQHLYIRALKLMQEGSDQNEAENLFRQFLQKTADKEWLREYRNLANAFLLTVTTDVTALSENEQVLIDQAGFTPAIYQQKDIARAGETMQSAIDALLLDKTDEFEDKWSQAESIWRRASDEFPKTRDLFSCMWLLFELMKLTTLQYKAFREFDFDTVLVLSSQVDQKVDELKQVHLSSKIQELITWAPQVAKTYKTISISLTNLTTLINESMSSGISSKHMENLGNLHDTLQGIRGEAAKLQGNENVINLARNPLLQTSSAVLHIIDNLRVELRPSRQAILNMSGLAAAVGFLFVIGITFLLGNFAGIELNPALVLSLGAFFGLVIGFGYGALRFRGFLLDIVGKGVKSHGD